MPHLHVLQNFFPNRIEERGSRGRRDDGLRAEVVSDGALEDRNERTSGEPVEFDPREFQPRQFLDISLGVEGVCGGVITPAVPVSTTLRVTKRASRAVVYHAKTGSSGFDIEDVTGQFAEQRFGERKLSVGRWFGM